MKLQYQLHIAFTTLLLVVLTITGFAVHSLLLDGLIQDEKRQLEQKGELLTSLLNNEQYQPREAVDFDVFFQEQNLQVFIYDRNQNDVLFSTFRPSIATEFLQKNKQSKLEKERWELGGDTFVASTLYLYHVDSGLELILLTPLTDLKAVQQALLKRLLWIFVIGAVGAIGLSYMLTRKLVTPLSRLQRQVKKIEKRQFDQLERVQASGEIKDVEQSVYDMATELQRYIMSQQIFMQNASHELKTPLMTIQGYAEGIKDRVFSEQEEEQGLVLMVEEVGRLKKIINEMILLAKLDSEQAIYTPEKVYVKQIIERVASHVLPLSHEQEVIVTTKISGEYMIWIDQEKLLRALLNITQNGIRHAHTNVEISALEDDQAVYIKIKDDGSGIDEALMPYLFHRFMKGSQGETGLGLAIARAIVEQSGGKIEVESVSGKGATFYLIFPHNMH